MRDFARRLAAEIPAPDIGQLAVLGQEGGVGADVGDAAAESAEVGVVRYIAVPTQMEMEKVSQNHSIWWVRFRNPAIWLEGKEDGEEGADKTGYMGKPGKEVPKEVIERLKGTDESVKEVVQGVAAMAVEAEK